MECEVSLRLDSSSDTSFFEYFYSSVRAGEIFCKKIFEPGVFEMVFPTLFACLKIERSLKIDSLARGFVDSRIRRLAESKILNGRGTCV